jgi:hypothetical protein
MISTIVTILDAAGQYYTLTPSAQKVLHELICGEERRQAGTYTNIRFSNLHFQGVCKLSEAGVEDAWKLLVKLKMIRINPRRGKTHIFQVDPIAYEFCKQLFLLRFHIKPKKYLKEVMEGLAENPRFLVHKYNGFNRKKSQKVPPSNPAKVPPNRTSSLVGLRSRVRTPDLESERSSEIPKIQPIVEGLPFFTDYEKYRISNDFDYLDILGAKQDMDNYKYKFMKTIYSEAGYFIDALNRQKRKRMSYGQ